jgi:hypothetical protein
MNRKAFWVAVPILFVVGGCGSSDSCDEAAAAAKRQQALAAAQVCTPGVSTCVGWPSPDDQLAWCMCPLAVNAAKVPDLNAVFAEISSECSQPCLPACPPVAIQEICAGFGDGSGQCF